MNVKPINSKLILISLISSQICALSCDDFCSNFLCSFCCPRDEAQPDLGGGGLNDHSGPALAGSQNNGSGATTPLSSNLWSGSMSGFPESGLLGDNGLKVPSDQELSLDLSETGSDAGHNGVIERSTAVTKEPGTGQDQALSKEPSAARSSEPVSEVETKFSLDTLQAKGFFVANFSKKSEFAQPSATNLINTLKVQTCFVQYDEFLEHPQQKSEFPIDLILANEDINRYLLLRLHGDNSYSIIDPKTGQLISGTTVDALLQAGFKAFEDFIAEQEGDGALFKLSKIPQSFSQKYLNSSCGVSQNQIDTKMKTIPIGETRSVNLKLTKNIMGQDLPEDQTMFEEVRIGRLSNSFFQVLNQKDELINTVTGKTIGPFFTAEELYEVGIRDSDLPTEPGNAVEIQVGDDDSEKIYFYTVERINEDDFKVLDADNKAMKRIEGMSTEKINTSAQILYQVTEDHQDWEQFKASILNPDSNWVEVKSPTPNNYYLSMKGSNYSSIQMITKNKFVPINYDTGHKTDPSKSVLPENIKKPINDKIRSRPGK